MGLRFSASHMWVRPEGGEAVIGVSEYLQDRLGDVTTLELPDIGDVIRATRRMGSIESEDAASPIEAPVSGEVTDVNPDVIANPDLVNSEPYASGWLLRVRMEDPGELEDLISEEEYAELTMEV